MDFKTIFLDYFQKCLDNDEAINIVDMQHISTGNEVAANEALNELLEAGIIIGIPINVIDKIAEPLNFFESFFLTDKGIDYIRKRQDRQIRGNTLAKLYSESNQYQTNLNNYYFSIGRLHSALAAYQKKLNSIPLDVDIINNARQLNALQRRLPRLDVTQLDMRNSFNTEQIQQIFNNYTNIGITAQKMYQGKNKQALDKFLAEIDKAKKDILDLNYVIQKGQNPIEFDTERKSFTFEGILGQNCGNVVEPSTEDEKRIQVKGFKVNDGLRVLRGFAKSSDLAAISQADENYQRDKYPEHVAALSDFIQNIKMSAKYLPEVTLVARGYKKLNRITLSGQLSPTQQGELDNLEYFRLTVNEKQLYRIDGNHRLEALQDNDYYIPFAIIIWEESKVNQDDEAFLFYFLNAKAQKLTSEENLKGLVNATSWKQHELIKANKFLPHLQYLEEQIKTNKFLSSFFCNNEPIKNIAEILEKIEDLKIEEFKEILYLTNELLINDKWQDLKQFKIYCQLVFYVAYRHKNRETCLNVLNNVNNWVKKYKFDDTTFNNPIMLYKSAEKTNNTQPIKVFVAMPYYDDEIIEDINDQLKKLTEELKTKYPLLENRLEIYEVMKHRGYEIDIQEQILEQIKSASIFIADISEHICKKGTKIVDSHANPNVMYELGLAKGQEYTEIILLKNQKDKIEVPSDIITKYHNKFEFDKKVSMRKKLFEAIENILKDKFEII